MKEGWNKYKFREVVNFQPSVKLQKGESYWFIPMEDIQEKTSYVFPKQKKVFDGSSGAKFKDGDIIFSRITPCLQNGKISQAVLGKNQSGFGSTEYFVFRGKDKLVDQKFLFYFVTSDAFTGSAINSMVGASGRQRADKGYISNLDIILPPIEEQRTISNVLSTYDDLIVNNTKRIAVLEQMAEQIYKEWFVRMRFPGYENTKFVKGIPEGWEVKKIDNAFKFLGGGTPSKENDSFWRDGAVNWYTPTDITGSKGIFQFNSELQCNEQGLRSSSAKLFPAYSIMMTSRATIGAFGINTTPACTNQGFITCLPNKEFPLYFLFLTLKSMKEFFLSVSTGATFPELTKGVFKKMSIMHPKQDLVDNFENLIVPIYDEIRTLYSQNSKLNESRLLLLPRLISGNLSVEHLTSKLQETA